MNCSALLRLSAYRSSNGVANRLQLHGIRSFSGSSPNKSKKGPGTTAIIDGQTIHYEKVGNGPQSLLLLPGALGSTRTDFAPQLDGLNRDLFTVIAWDPPGYGFSRPKDRQFYSAFLRNDAKVADSLLSHLGIKTYSLLGWSDGGITALIMAAKYPEKMDKLVVWGANAYIGINDMKMYSAVKDVRKWSENMRKPMIDLYGEEYFTKSWTAWVDTFFKIYEEKDGDLCKSEVKKIKCPTFILHGAKDPMVPEEHPKFLKNSIENSELHTFPEGKHNIHLKYSSEFNELVTKFLTRKEN